MANIGTLTAHIGVDNMGLNRGLAQAQGRFSQFSAGAMKSIAKIGGAFAALGLAVGGLAIFRSITKTGIDFEQTMTTVAGVMRATADESKRLAAAARKMGETTEWSASEAGGALQFLGMAGFEANKAIAALPGTLDLATAGQIGLGRAADIATNALTAMGLEVEELERVNDVFVGTITRSNTNMEMMAESFKYAAPVARAYGYTVEELSGLIGMLGNAGIQGSMAGTQLAMAMQKTNVVAEKFGVEGGKFVDVLEQLREKGYKSTEVMTAFGLRAGRAAGVLYEATDATREFQETLGGVQGEAKRLADTMRSTVGASFKELKSVVESLALDVFEVYRDELKGFVVDTTTWIRENKNQIVAFAGDIMNVLEDLIERFTELNKILLATRDPLSFYPKDLSEIDNWLAKIKDKLTWLFDRLPQFYFFRKMIAPFRGEGWDEFLSDLEKANMWLGMIEKKLPLPSLIGPQEFIGPLPAPPSPTLPPPVGGVGGAMLTMPTMPTMPTEGLAEFIARVQDMVAEYKAIQQNRYDWLYAHERISADQYLAFLEQKLGGEDEYSNAWIAIQERIESIKQGIADKDRLMRETRLEEWKRTHEFEVGLYESLAGAVGTAFQAMLTSAKSFTDVVKAGLFAFRDAFLNVITQLLTKWIASFLIEKAAHASTMATMLAAHTTAEVAMTAVTAAEAAKRAAIRMAAAPFGFFGAGGSVGMQGGGLIGGARWPKDVIPIMATGGEFMMREPAVRAVGVPALDYMNRTGRIPGGDEGPIHVSIGDVTIGRTDTPRDFFLLDEFKDAVVELIQEKLKNRELTL